MRTLRRCALIFGDALIACIEILMAPLGEAEVREAMEARASRKRERDHKRSQTPAWFDEARVIRSRDD